MSLIVLLIGYFVINWILLLPMLRCVLQYADSKGKKVKDADVRKVNIDQLDKCQVMDVNLGSSNESVFLQGKWIIIYKQESIIVVSLLWTLDISYRKWLHLKVCPYITQDGTACINERL